ncbi:uncharacterized protein Z519_05699 [Cladophialophora bantiana CBS 173.52]|uniref:Uncharacterized protein n=1 Tax=Cladophialophora bantiana (strain ATCC 10958 / CBS 173.52 / CDC B-1940 / NIH 8579) TaxID=1442370 RepID=A0A0D2I8F2_CLAB1|nr:uncharacterized protein Z519_05699 [Cladophialophora bantiana CBS 173.52]KIW93094.1 hypothetical protein Z519_05699 [Cladophialophora bantiana CBS 173.52]
MKEPISVEELCQGLPAKFAKNVSDIHGLEQRRRPGYLCLRKLFNDLSVVKVFQNENVFDWTIRELPRTEAGSRSPVVANGEGKIMHDGRGSDQTQRITTTERQKLRAKRQEDAEEKSIGLGKSMRGKVNAEEGS